MSQQAQNEDDSSLILQWNSQSINNKRDELLDIISTGHPRIIAIQETKIGERSKFRIPPLYVIVKRRALQ